MFTPEATRKAEANIKKVLPFLWRMPPVPLGTPLYVQVVCFLRRPPTVKERIILPATKPDLDNYEKLVLDSMNQVVFKDDGCVCCIEGWKVYANDDEQVGYGIKVFRLERAPDFRVEDFQAR
jgi:Holliday junction resolvase RusA-like endonuclease